MSDDEDFEGGGYQDDEESDFEVGEETPKKKTKASKKSDTFEFGDDETSKKKPKKKKDDGEKNVEKKRKKKEEDQKEDAPKKKPKTKNIEETYKKLDQIEHVLTRPDMYIGSANIEPSKMWIWENSQMVFKKIQYVPGLLKIFDEILVNAADNKQRDPNMKELKVEINSADNYISVYNDGEGIPVEIHKEHNIYIPELIFGYMLTGSNFDDEEEKVTGGRNGLGAKLANIYSTEFVVECVDNERGKKFKQTFRNNMAERDKPSITSVKGKSCTKITFKPDLARFGMETLSEDMVGLMTKRVYDIAGCHQGLKVSLNGEVIKIKNFEKYCDMFLQDPTRKKIYQRLGDRWEICISTSNGEFQQNSYVNSICTSKGGTHVTNVVKKITKELAEAVKKKNRAAPVTPAQIKNHLWVFVNCLIVNPAFDGQPKHALVTPVGKFGSKVEFSEEFIKKVKKCGVVEQILEFAKGQTNKALKKTEGSKRGRLTGIAKLDDANDAGTKNSSKCTLILTEGDSAKTFAVAGLGVVGRDNYGVFPLRGKFLNVRDATHNQVVSNAEINHLKQILGLKHGKAYTDIKELRYGHLMIMTDQDHDGSHIKGLLINFVHHFWPSLLKVPGFMREFITPIVKAKHVRDKNKQISFFTIPEYQKWKKQVQEDGEEKQWKIFYYKGLGTSSNAEAKEYFSQLEKHQIDFVWETEEDGNSIDMAFNKKRVEDRKDWIRNYKPGTDLDLDIEELNYSDFINKELIQFSIADCARSIPSIVDGFKPGQRKILFACFKKKSLLKDEMKVAQLASYVSMNTSYHHGETSLQEAIVKMAQNFVGSNNVNLLYPAGQFGSRIMGGEDAASPRYIFTKLAKITRTIFPADDDHILTYLDDDGMPIEPKYYVPVVPLVLINGCEGIGTGWSTSIPNYNPEDVIKNMRHLIKGEEIEPMHPWYRGFKGKIELEEGSAKKPGGYKISGIWERIEDDVIDITELPVGIWTQKYKETLEGFVQGSEKVPAFIKDYKEYHTETTVHFRIEFLPGKLDAMIKEGKFEKKMKIISSIATSNMHCFDAEGRMKKYENVGEILNEFYAVRLASYEKRKQYLVDTLTQEWTKLDNRVRFILAVIKEEIIVRNRKRADLLLELEKKGFDKFETKKKKSTEEEEEQDEDEAEEKKKKKASNSSGYDYLLSMPLWSLTLEKVEKLLKERKDKEAELNVLLGTAPKDLWEKDLDKFEQVLHDWYADEDAEASHSKKIKRVAAKGRGKGRKAASKKQEESDDDEFVSEKPKRAAPTAKAPAKETTVPKVPKAAAPKAKATSPAKKSAASQKTTLDSLWKKPSGDDPMDVEKPAKETKPKDKPATKSSSSAPVIANDL